MTDVPKEAYLWDSRLNYIIQLTHLTQDMLKTSTPNVHGYYNFSWLSSTQLLVGIFVVEDNTQITKTIRYNTESKSFVDFSPGTVQEIAINPVNRKYAFSTVQTYRLSDYSPILAQITIGEPILESLDTVQNADAVGGSNFFWSPDGKMLAYQKAASNDFVFVTDGDPPVVSYTFSDSSIATDMASKTAYVLPIGWGAG